MAKRKTVASEKVQMTREERIKRAWETRHRVMGSEELTPSVPDCRRLAIGDKVEVGNLEDCVVAGLSDDGRFVLVEYTSVRTNYGKPIRDEHQLGVWPWMSVFPLDQIEDTCFAKEGTRPSFLNANMSSLISTVFNRGVVDNPDYQRDYVWTLEDKQRLIESVLAERNIGSFIFVQFEYEKHEGKLEVLDGKQRLNALSEFYTSRFTYKGKFFHQLSWRDRYRFKSLDVSYAYLDGERMSRAELLEMFLESNTSGVPQTEAHLDKVRQMLIAEKAG